MKIDEKLRIAYDWAFPEWPLFTKCGNKFDEKLRIAYNWAFPEWPLFAECGNKFDEKTENVLCFSEGYCKTINWKEIQKLYESKKEVLDPLIEKEKARRLKCKVSLQQKTNAE